MSKILICTGIFPPQVGGPAQYAKEITDEFKRQGHQVKVLTYRLERKLPTLVRHELFFWRTFFILLFWRPSFVVALDTFSVGWPAVMAAKLFRKKILIRTGGDFLWESYVERTGDLVLLRNFYDTCQSRFNFKERTIFSLTQWTLRNATAVIFSTEWQKQIFEKAYGLNSAKNFIIENFYGEKLPSNESAKKNFISGGRNVKLKNSDRLKQAFEAASVENRDISLDLLSVPYQQFMERLKSSYAVILASVSDISPNMILEAIRYNKPFILTKESGAADKLRDIAIFVDPENVADIKEKILYLADENNYEIQKKKIQSFNFLHSWKNICEEIIAIARV